MAKPKPNLLGVLDSAVAPSRAAPPPPLPTASEGAVNPLRYKAPSRQGKTLVGGHLPPEYARTLKLLSAETGIPQQELLQRALDMLFTAQRIDLR